MGAATLNINANSGINAYFEIPGTSSNINAAE